MDKIKFGIFLPFYLYRNTTEPTALFNQLKTVVLECERLGYDSVWLDDHLMYGNMPILECWTTLSALCAVTSKIRLGTMVTSNAFRNPALTAKMAATVDLVSGGRLELGLGAGVQSQEHAAYGFDFPSFRVRVQRLTESLQIITSLWTQEKTTYKGAHFRVVDAVCEPKPVQKPHPPLVVGGSGERYLLKVTAQYADRFDFSYLPTIELYQHKLHVLESHCKAVGRNFDEIEKSCWPQGQIILGSDKAELEQKIANLKPKGVSKEAFAKAHFLGTPQQYVDTLKPYLDLGVTYFMQYFADLPDVGSLQLFAPFIKN